MTRRVTLPDSGTIVVTPKGVEALCWLEEEPDGATFHFDLHVHPQTRDRLHITGLIAPWHGIGWQLTPAGHEALRQLGSEP